MPDNSVKKKCEKKKSGYFEAAAGENEYEKEEKNSEYVNGIRILTDMHIL